MAKVDKYSIHGLKRRPTYEEIRGIIDESNEKITGKLPNRDATFFRNSPEGSMFDGSDAMEQLKEEQGRLLLRQMSEILLRQNVRTAGRTFHVERNQRLPTTSPTIARPTQPMNVDEGQPTTQSTPTAPTFNTQQASQIQTELQQRGEASRRRREETTMNHRGEMFKQNKPTITQQIHHINPPRTFTPIKPVDTPVPMSDTDELMTDTQMRNRATATSSNQPPPSPLTLPRPATTQHFFIGTPNETKTPKRNSPETAIEPKGKAGRPKIRYTDTRADAEKRDGSSPEDEPKTRKKRNKKKDEALPAITAQDADDEGESEQSNKKQRKPLIPSKIGIQKLYEEFTNAKNKDIISEAEFKEFNAIFMEYRQAKGKEKSKYTNKAKELYKKVLYKKLMDIFNKA